MPVTSTGDWGIGLSGFPLHTLPVNRLQAPHLVAAKMLDDETEGYVVITVAGGVTTSAQAAANWGELLLRFPNLRTEFLRIGHQMYQRLAKVDDCATRMFIAPHEHAAPHADSFTHPSIYVWDPCSQEARLWLHHAIVDSFTIDLLKRGKGWTDSQSYQRFLARVAAETGEGHGPEEDLCRVRVRHAAGKQVCDSAEMSVEAPGQQVIQSQGAFNFWFACLCDSLADLGVAASDKILVPMSFRDVLGELYGVPGLAMGSIAIDIAPEGASPDSVQRGLLRGLRERSDRLVLAGWNSSATAVPLEFAYDDAGARLARSRNQPSLAGIEVIQHSPANYLVVCSAGMGLVFTDFRTGDLFRALERSARRRGVLLRRSAPPAPAALPGSVAGQRPRK